MKWKTARISALPIIRRCTRRLISQPHPSPSRLLVRPDHPLALNGRAATVEDLLACQLVLTPTTFGIGHAIKMLEYAEKIEIRPALVSNSLAALKRLIAAGDFASLLESSRPIGKFAKGSLAAVPIDHPIFSVSRRNYGQVRRLGRLAQELLNWMLQRLPMFTPGEEV